jgi:leucyl aminopeptidase
MEFSVRTTPLGRHADDAVVLFTSEGERITRKIGSAGAGFRPGYDTLVGNEAFTGKAGQVRTLAADRSDRFPLLVLCGLGPAKAATRTGLREAAGAAGRAARDHGARTLAYVPPEGRGGIFHTGRACEAIADGAVTGLYRFDAYKSTKDSGTIDRVTLVVGRGDKTRAERGAREGRLLGEGVVTARSLGNEPGNTATPAFLAQRALELGEAHGFAVRVLDEDEMEALGMGSLLGVSRGSAEPAKLIVMTYEPARPKGRDTVAIVGKGLTFDTGGISIKPAPKLEDMKFDMCGGAAAIGTMQTIARLGIPTRVVGLVPASENMPDGDSYKPGDILKAMNGTTIEIRNTDAEGRLILADALAYATSKLRPRPKAVVDLATLTGACVTALGDGHAALVSNNDALAERLLAASATSEDALWRMPINDIYRRQIESPYADISNLGTPGAGVLTAAAFLERFTGKVPWAHLDIAGMAWTSKTGGTSSTGATGFGVRVMSRFLQNW